MQSTAFDHLADTLCEFLPRASLTVLDAQDEPLYSLPAGQPLSRPPKVESLYYDPITHTYLQSIPFPNGRTLLIQDRAPTQDIAKERCQMAESVVRLLLSQRGGMSNQPEDKLSTMTLLADRLFHITTADSATFLALWAGEIGFDLSLPRAICVFDLQTEEINRNLQSSLLRLIHTELSTHHSDTQVHSALEAQNQNIVAPINNRQIALLTVVPSASVNLRELIYPYISELCTTLMDRYNLSVRVGVGSVPEALYEYGVSLTQAQTALKYARLFETRQVINFISDFSLEDEMTRVPQDTLHHFLEPYIKRLSSPHLLDTIQALIHCNMDISQTANYLYVHRNTVLFRLDQIKRQLGLNPLHNDSDRFTLRMLYSYYKLFHTGKP